MTVLVNLVTTVTALSPVVPMVTRLAHSTSLLRPNTRVRHANMNKVPLRTVTATVGPVPTFATVCAVKMVTVLTEHASATMAGKVNSATRKTQQNKPRSSFKPVQMKSGNSGQTLLVSQRAASYCPWWL